VVITTTVEDGPLKVLKAVFDPIGVLGVYSAPPKVLVWPCGAWKAAKTLLNQNRSFSLESGWSPRLARGLAKCALDK
jgi:hypothetical protein